jgi:hypothetical protein
MYPPTYQYIVRVKARVCCIYNHARTHARTHAVVVSLCSSTLPVTRTFYIENETINEKARVSRTRADSCHRCPQRAGTVVGLQQPLSQPWLPPLPAASSFCSAQQGPPWEGVVASPLCRCGPSCSSGTTAPFATRAV